MTSLPAWQWVAGWINRLIVCVHLTTLYILQFDTFLPSLFYIALHTRHAFLFSSGSHT